MTDEIKTWINNNTVIILVVFFVGWTVLMQVLNLLFKLNILKIVVLAGTFALAMAFAGNDLVNFIGVPLAGFESFKDFIANHGNNNPDNFLMTSLSGKIQTDTYLLVIAGLIMVATLWLSKKARNVIKTSLDLSRQTEGVERFGSSLFARTLVRSVNSATKGINILIPKQIKVFIFKRFDQTPYINETKKEENAPVFDLIRASVNLVVASILIAFATSLKLPLSTTYVTFMVAMGTSLSDRAWGRESAVYRISGVLSVIGGWFFTALAAFTAAFALAYLISYGGFAAIFILIGSSLFNIIPDETYHS
jgi:hypothetical protein